MKNRFKIGLVTLLAVMGMATFSTVPQAMTATASAQQVKLSTKTKANSAYHANDDTGDDTSDDDIGDYDLIVNSYKVKHASAAAAMDADTGKILFTQNGSTNRRIASLSKLMTLYLAIQKAQRTTNGWNQIVKTSGNGLKKMGQSASVGGFRFKAGHRYTVRQLYQAALIQSSNNATIALGRWVAGSNAKFIDMMNDQAEEWGLDSTFVSASGLDNVDLKPYGYWARGSYYAGNQVSAEDILIIAKHLLDLYPSIINDSSKSVAYVDGQKLSNENRLLRGQSFYTSSLNVDGLKTGYTPTAGLCLVATSQRPGQHRLLTVVLNDKAEFTDTRDFMNFVYRNADVYTGSD